MSYIQKSDLELSVSKETLKQLTQDDLMINNYNEDVINNAIVRAEGLIDSYLVKVANLPLSEVPQIVKNICIDIALYYIYAFRIDNKMPTIIDENYKFAIETLKNIIEGKIGLLNNSKCEFVILTDKEETEIIYNKDIQDTIW